MRTIGIAVVVLVCSALAPVCLAQPASAAPAGEGLMAVVPQQAVAFVERRGHEVIHEAYVDSNFGKLGEDPVIQQFAYETRDKTIALIAKGLFEDASPEQAKHNQELILDLAKPFWYRPCVAFLVLDKEGFGKTPGFGFVCMTDKYMKPAKDALDELMKIGVVPAGQTGTRQAFTYASGPITWQGVAHQDEEFTLPNDAAERVTALRKSTLFMAYWSGPMLCLATSIDAADATSAVLSGSAPGMDSQKGLQPVLRQTAMKDWAFRWYVDVERLFKVGMAGGEAPPPQFVILGLDKIRGIGGTEGYADKVYTRLTFVDAPDCAMLKVLQPGGSYKAALDMVPQPATFCLAGQIQPAVLGKLVRDCVVAQNPSGGRPAFVNEDSESTSKPATQPAAWPTTWPTSEPGGEGAKALDIIESLAAMSDGRAAGFVGDIQGIIAGMLTGFMGGAGPDVPAGAVFGIKDPAKARELVRSLAQMAGGDSADASEPGDQPTTLPSETTSKYRNVQITRIAEIVRLAVMNDRVIVTAGDSAMKSVIDTALDKLGGVPADSAAGKLATLTGDGPVLFVMDTPSLLKAVWPLINQVFHVAGDDMPLGSLPSQQKLLPALSPEMAVMQPVEGGLLLKSRGTLPFATKVMLLLPTVNWLDW